MNWFQPLFGRKRTDSRESEKLRFESIEPRVLFSATAVEPVVEEVEAHHQPPLLEIEDQVLIATPSEDSGPSLPEDADAILIDLNFHAADIDATERREIVFLSTTVEDYEYLLEHLDPAYEVFLIDGESDGISQIAGALEGLTGVDAIHLIGHGNEGRLYLGETVLDAESMLGQHRSSLESISAALSPDADLLIYGCDFTAGESGLAAARLLAALTGADVAASTDDTGSEALGGDWDLETTIGTTESRGLAVPTWNGVLAGAAPVLDLNSSDAVTVASDDFSSNSASGGTGWSGNWTKVNDPDGNDVQWTGGTMILREFDKLPSVTRTVDLSGYYNPSITLTYSTSGNLESDDTFRFEYSTDGGTNWTVLENFADDSGATRTYSLGTIGTASTVFRARLTGGSGDNTEIFTIDNVSVSANLPNHSASYLTNAVPVAITSTNVGITDGDDTHIQSATVTLTNRQPGDLLSVIGGLPSGITASSYNSGTGVLTLSGNATKAQYEAALEQIFYSSSSNVAGNRVINVTVNDGTGNSNTAVSTIAVTLDSDGDGVANDLDLDDDGDGILDTNEMNLVTTSSVTTTLNYNAALSAAAPLVNGQPQIILTDGTVTISITNVVGAQISGSRVTTDNSTGSAESIRITATSPSGTVFIQGLRFTDLDNFDWDNFVDALALDQLGTWSNLTNTAGGQGLVSYTNDTSGETAATTATGETVSFANLRAAGAVSPVILNPARTDTENNYQATFTLATAVSTLRVFGSDAVLPMNQVTEFSFTTFPITYYTQYLEDRDTDGDGTIDRLDIDSDNDGITDNVEAQATASYVAPSGSDADSDGLDDVYDANDANTSGSVSLGLTPVDTDADGTADYRDADSDNDGHGDIVERGDGQTTSITSTTDTDRDGLLDIFEGSNNNDGYDANDENLSGSNFTLAKSPTLNSNGSNAIPLLRDLLFRKTNVAPVDGNESNSVNEDATLTVSAGSGLLANATDGDGNTLTISTFSITGQSGPFVLGSAYAIPSVGSITLFANGSYSFTPLPNYNGAVPTVNYTVADGFGGTDTSVLTLSINPLNDAPANVVPGPATTSEDTALVITGVTVSDVDGGSLTTTISIPSGAGILSVVTGGGAGITGNGTNSVVITGSAVQINAALASITYTPTADFNTGTPAVPFNLNVLTSDGTLSDSDNIAITVTPVADIAADTVSTDEDVAAVFNVLTGTNGATADSFENAGRAVTSVTQGANGTVTFNINGTITYTPAPGWSGSDSFTYTVTSGGVTETTTVNVSVAAVNDPPVNVVPASQTTNEDTALVITGITVSDADGGSLTTTISIPSGAGTLSVVTGGSAGITGNGTNSVVITGSATQINAALASITYTPTADYNTGTPSVPFNLNVITSDGTISDSDNIAITVTPVVDIVADSVSTDEDAALVFNVLTGTNGATADGFENGGRAVTSVTQGAHGTVSFNANGELTYTPNPNYVGSDSFTYTVISGGVTETTTVNVTVNATNDVPVNVVPGAQSTSEDTALIITGVSVSDLDGDALTTTLSIPSGAGTLTVVTGGGAGISGNGTNSVVITGSAALINAALASITYTPTADFNTGTPAVPFNLNVLTSDGTSSDSDNIAVTVTPIVDIVADSVTTDEDTAIVFNVLTGTNGATADTFENGGRVVTSVTQGAHGTVSFNANGELTYTPGLNFAGSDSFTYTVTSGGVTETTTVNVTVDPVNDGPSNLIPGAQSTSEDTALVITGVGVADVDGDSLTTTLSIPGGAGVLTVLTGGGAAITGNGTNSVVITGSSTQINAALASITYTPTADYHTGTPAVPFNLNVLTSDGTLSDSDDVAITVTPAADAVDDFVTTDENQAIVFNVLTGTNGASADSFENGGRVLSSVTQGAHGSVTFNANGEITYTPDASFYGTDTFTYTVTSGGVTETATVEVTVDPINDAPVLVVPAAQTTNEDNTLVISGVSVSDVDGDPLTLTITIPSAAGLISVVTGGGASISGNGSDTITISGSAAQINAALASITYTPTADFNTGTPAVPISLGVVVSDGVASVSNSVAITVTPVADIVTDSVETDEDTAIAFNAITGTNGASADSFENSGRAVTSVTQGANGSVAFLANGAITYTPNLNWHGSDSFSYTVTSGGVSETIVVDVVVNPVNDTPTAVGTIPGQNDNDAELISPLNVATFFQDIDSGDVLTFSDGGTLPPGLSIDVNTGIISGTLDASASVGGPYSVVITAEDASGATVTQTFTWTVNNPGPDAQDDSFAADEDDGAAVVGNAILNNDSDPDGDALTVQIQTGVTGTQGGLFSIAANGQVTFDTNGEFEDLAAGETRQTSFTYTLVDADGATSTATVTVTVTGENDTPITIGTISNQTNNDSDSVTLNVSGAFGDPDTTDVLTYSDGGTLPPGLVIDSNTGIISGTLDSSASAGGPYTVVVTAEDSSGATATQTFTWTVNNLAPVAQDDDFAADEDDGSAVVGNAILNNDSDPDGDALTAQIQSGVAGTQGGLFSIAANGQVTFDTNGEFEDLAVGETRQTSFTYTLVDADGATSTATVTVTVTGENDTPITIGAISNQTNNDSDSVTLNVSGAFGDPDATDVLTYSDGGTLPPGLAIDANTGIISGTLDASASAGGPYTVVITAEDPSGATVTQTFTWTVNNPGPDAQDDSFTADEDDGAAVVGNAILNNDSDPDGDALTAQVQSGVSGTQGGLFSIAANGQVTFETNGEFEDLAVGETRQTGFTYTLVDADGATSTATVTVTVTGENDTPITIGAIANQTNNDSEVVTLNVSGAFGDPDTTDVLTYSDGGTLPPGLTIDANTGIISGTLDASASAGGPYTVVITAEDASGATVTQTFTWTVNNPGPDAQDDSFTADEDDGATVVGNAILNNDSDPDGDALTAQIQSGVAGTQGGLFSITADGQVTFDTNGDFEDLAVGETRQTSFTYTLVDADGATSTATVTVTVSGENDTPVTVGTIVNQANNDSDSVTLDVSGAFGDPDTTDVLTYSDGGTLPPGLVIDANTGIISGTLDSSASAGGPYTVVVTAEDSSGATVTQTFTWTVNNPAPIAQDDNFAANEDDGSGVVGNAILNNDSDPDGDALTAQVQSGVSGSQGGLFSIAANGQVTFDTNGDFEDLAVGETRQTSFTYTLVDADGATSTATVTVTVTGENDTPIQVGTISDQTNDDSDPVTLDVSGTFGDPDTSDALTFSAGGTLPPGLSIDANTGIISGTLDSSASVGGPYTVVVTAEDPSGATVTQTFTWTVNNPGPDAQDDDFAADEDDGSAVVGNAILNNDSDPDGDALTAQVRSGVAGTQGGLFSIDSSGQVTFDTNGEFEDLAAGETRQTSFTYTLEDADGAMSTATVTVTVTVTGENDTPIAVGTVANQTNNDSDSVTLNVSGAFGDPDATDVLTYSDGGTLPPGLSIDANTGIISGTLDSSASAGGPYTVVVTAEDSSGATATQTFTWTVNNLAPVAQDDDFAADEDDGSAVVGNAILNNDSDPDGDALTAQIQSGVAGTQGGLFSIAANGQVTFDTNGEFEDLAVGETRQTSFTYTLVDADGATSTATVTVTVTGENDTPITVGTISNQTNEDADPVVLNVSGAFADPDATDVLTYSDGGTLPPGLAIDANTGIISGTLDASASAGGPYTVVITAEDPSGATVTQTFTWTVNNPGPIAQNDDFAADEDDGVAVVGNAILNNDSDPDGDALTAQIQSGVAGTQGGLFTIAANGQVTFDTNGEFEDLAAGETRQTSFTYTLVDADGATSTATVMVTVMGENDTPVTVGTVANQTNNDSDAVTLDESGAFGDPDASDVLTYSDGGTLPPGLVIDANTGIISGTLDASASSGGPYTVVITAEDSSGATVTQTFTWTVNNPAPIALDDSFAADEDDGAAVVGNAILNNDSDPDGDALTAQVQSGVAGSQGGLFSIAADGQVTFDTNGEFEVLAVGETRQTSFTYTLVDADGATSTATVTVTVTGENDTPVTVGTVANQTNNDSDAVTLDVSGAFGDPDTTDVLTYSAGGTLPPGLTIDANTGIISGTLDSSASAGGPYTVVITAEDSSGATVTQTFTWMVNNLAPVAQDDQFAADEDDSSAVVGNAILNNDSDPDGDALTAQIQSGVAGTQGGLFSIAANGQVTFDTNGDFEDLAVGETRQTSFTYTLVDADGATSTATVMVTVTGENDTPVTVGTVANQTNNDSDAVTLDVSGAFGDPDTTDVLTYSAGGTLPPGLTIDLNTGIISGTLDSSASAGGPYTVVVTAEDSSGANVTQTFTWTVNNPAPIALDDSFAADEDDGTAVVGNAILNNDSDPDGDALTAQVQSGVAGTQGGLFSIAADGQVTFDTNGEFEDLAVGETRQTSFTYTLVDADGATSTATVTVTVTGENDAPIMIGAVANQTNNDSDAVTLNVSGAFGDPDTTDVLTYTDGGTLPPGLTVDLNTGIISGTLDASASVGGPYTVVITAEDPSGATVTQTFTWTVNNPAPVAQDDSFAADEDGGVAVVGNAILNNDSDPDGDALTAQVRSGFAGTQGGLFSIDSSGQVTFDTNGEFEDLAAGETRQTSFTYTLEDADGAMSTATVTVTVTGENDTPIAVGTVANQTNNDSDAVTLNVSGVFGDPDATDVLTYSDGGTLPPGLSIDANTGIISGTLDSSASAGGPYTVVITAEDASGATVTQTFTWTVNNPGPDAQDDSFAADEDDGAAVVGNAILNNDSDPDGDALTVQIQTGVAGTQGGLFSIAANGQVTFDTNGEFEDLAAGETRQTSFTYTLVDADGATSTATVTVTVTGENDTPITIGTISNQTNNDSDSVTLNVSGAFGDPDTTDVLTYSDGGTLPPGLSIDANTGIISGTLDSSASAGGPYSVVITAEDASGATVTQTFTWTVNNLAPVAQDDSFAADEDDGAAVVGNAILNNDSDPDGDALAAQNQSGVAGTQGGLFSIAANGQVTFDTNGEFEDLAVGETRQTSFTYTLVDADGATSTATVTVTVTGENDTPVPVGTIANQTNNDSDTVTLDVSGAFADPDATDGLTYSDGGTLPPGLTIDLNTGLISGTLDSSASLSAPYLVRITAQDGSGAMVTRTFVWTVKNPSPEAINDAFAVGEDDAATVVGNAILNNDSDPDGDLIGAQVQNGVVGSHGGLFSIDASGEVTFDPNGDFEDLALGETRQTSFTYTILDADGATDTAMVTVTVTGVNDSPISTGSIPDQDDEDSDTVTLNVGPFFADPDQSDTLTFSATGLPPGLTINSATGVISGTLDSSASSGGPYTVEITVEDEAGVTFMQSFVWTVSNPTPVAGDDFFNVEQGSGVVMVGNAITGNDLDPDGDGISSQLPTGQGNPHSFNAVVMTGVAGSQGGTFAIDANGDVTFDPGDDFDDLIGGESRVTTFTYLLADADGATTTGMVSVTVFAANTPPVADSGAITVPVGSNGGKLGLEAPADPEGDVLTIQVSRLPKVGVLRLANGKPVVMGQFLSASQLEKLVYDAPAQYRGKKPVFFRYLVSDGQYSTEAIVKIRIVKSTVIRCQPGDFFQSVPASLKNQGMKEGQKVSGSGKANGLK